MFKFKPPALSYLMTAPEAKKKVDLAQGLISLSLHFPLFFLGRKKGPLFRKVALQ